MLNFLVGLFLVLLCCCTVAWAAVGLFLVKLLLPELLKQLKQHNDSESWKNGPSPDDEV